MRHAPYLDRCGHIDEAIINVEVMLVKSENKKQKEFKGVLFDVLASDDKSMVTKMNYRLAEYDY